MTAHSRETIWRCDCHGSHFVSLDMDEDFPLMIVEVCDYPESWRDRLRLAWQAMRGERIVRCEVLLSLDRAEQLAMRLNELLDKLRAVTMKGR